MHKSKPESHASLGTVSSLVTLLAKRNTAIWYAPENLNDNMYRGVRVVRGPWSVCTNVFVFVFVFAKDRYQASYHCQLHELQLDSLAATSTWRAGT